MPSRIATLLICLTVLSVVSADYLCNCYCPTSSTYAGSGTYSSSSTTCSAQTCANACVGSFSACVLGSTWGSCRNAGNGLTIPMLSLMMGLGACFVKRFF
ncbi:unnamed protein product [Rotaria socialis]|uniref:Uncharacterized protein n=1 Tax=Rotaria socialis TaxID=392032 RepID=A0A818B036_9BILA|nr:unnamed protein product [Rotaria socialis]